ncbi:endoplasmic reticulum protein [Cryptococcus deuterogattii LA55]|nr:endoplasmic reticulum protein [Cryptococcus deuterogattii LA55]KIR36095.1 endoplasmic reticulum protein [Cryptococcus deuterogattii MMRL2647]KIR75528.1 endoplasmic reticulum protein [Cryptococcus deuterogattii CA1014]KIR95468.1 endoplasmic reticulum protein [Cryptococcus deuterogattii CBS 10090]KIS01964.1 endoplasmic reticulum protein [Cryptococcus deuterogattii 2001/935-1]
MTLYYSSPSTHNSSTPTDTPQYASASSWQNSRSSAQSMFHFLSENPVVAKIQYGLKITFIFVAVLFVDALQRMIRIAQEGATAKMKQDMADARTETNYYTALQAKTAKASGAAGENEELRNRIAELEAKERDFETLKKQASQQNAEYGRLADEHNKATGTVSDKKSD